MDNEANSIESQPTSIYEIEMIESLPKKHWFQDNRDSFLWYTNDGRILKLDEMVDRHCFNSMKMIYNHLAPDYGMTPVMYTVNWDRDSFRQKKDESKYTFKNVNRPYVRGSLIRRFIFWYKFNRRKCYGQCLGISCGLFCS